MACNGRIFYDRWLPAQHDRLFKLRDINWLSKVKIETRFGGAHSVLGLSPAGDGDERHVFRRRHGANRARDSDSAHAGQAKVKQDDLGREVIEDFDGLLP